MKLVIKEKSVNEEREFRQAVTVGNDTYNVTKSSDGTILQVMKNGMSVDVNQFLNLLKQQMK